MKEDVKHIPLILIGNLLWVASFFGEIFRLQPFSMVGMVVSIILTFWGIFLWFKYYKNTRGHYPKFYKAWRDNYSNSRKKSSTETSFLFSHKSEFWSLCILIWIGMVLFSFLTFGQSKAFKMTKDYCQVDEDVLSVTGNIKYYGFLFGGSVSSQNFQKFTEISFFIVAENGNFSAKSELTKYQGEWEILNVEINNND